MEEKVLIESEKGATRYVFLFFIVVAVCVIFVGLGECANEELFGFAMLGLGAVMLVEFGCFYYFLVTDTLVVTDKRVYCKRPEIDVPLSEIVAVDCEGDLRIKFSNGEWKKFFGVKNKEEIYDTLLPYVGGERVNRRVIAGEVRVRCNVCGNIYCFNDRDKVMNSLNNGAAWISGISSVANALNGNYYHAYEQGKIANYSSNNVRDFSRCPYCNSSDVEVI